MELTKLGWNADLSQQFAPHHTNGLVPARVAVEDKHFFRVWTADAPAGPTQNFPRSEIGSP